MPLTRIAMLVYLCGMAKLNIKIGNMTKFCAKNRRESTSVRDNEIHRMYREILNGFGEAANAVSKTYIYEKIHERTKLSIRTISFIINHTKSTH